MFDWLLLMAVLTITGDEAMTNVLRPVIGAVSYQFTVDDGMPGPAVQGKYQKGSPLHCQADGIEFFRKGDVLVYLQGDKWQRTRTGTLSDPLRILGASAKVRAVRTPHEELAQLAQVGVPFKKGTEKDQTLFTADLPEKAAKEFARSEDREQARSGTAKLWLDDKGQLVKYQIAIRVLGRRGNADVDGIMTRTVTLSHVGTAKLDVPPAAQKALE